MGDSYLKHATLVVAMIAEVPNRVRSSLACVAYWDVYKWKLHS